MSTSIYDYQLPYDTHKLYDVTFSHRQINTLVTHSPFIVDGWIASNINAGTELVGLDVEWRPIFGRGRIPLSILQLCTATHCLIYQLQYTPNIPPSLGFFLENTRYTFMGVGIHEATEKLKEEHGLSVGRMVDLRALAAQKTGQTRLRNAGLKHLAGEVLGVVVENPRSVKFSDWDCQTLLNDQVTYACVDAFLSYEIGRQLYYRL